MCVQGYGLRTPPEGNPGSERWRALDTRKTLARFFDEEMGAHAPGYDESDVRKSELTPRETEVLTCITAGCSNKEVAEKLFISEKTVKTHLNSIFRKLPRVTKRLQAILYALDRGMTT